MSARNYADLAKQETPQRMRGASATEAALLGERDAVMLCALHTAATKSGRGGRVVGVVGASHLPGMRRLWEAGSWRVLMEKGLLDAPTQPRCPESPEDTGVRCV